MSAKCCYCKNNSFIKAQDILFEESFECNHCGKTNHINDMLLLKLLRILYAASIIAFSTTLACILRSHNKSISFTLTLLIAIISLFITYKLFLKLILTIRNNAIGD